MILCADDFGLREDIDDAILRLASSAKLSAVSCMTLFERCSGRLCARLALQRNQLDIGLHLCFTDERLPLSFDDPKPLIFSSFTSCLKKSLRSFRREDLQHQIARQFEIFTAKFGFEPDYIDGHLHIHQVPALREALIAFILGLPIKRRPYVRNTYLPIRRLWQHRLPWTKAWLIGVFGKGMASKLCAAGIRTNDGFSGIYDFRDADAFNRYFDRFSNCLGSRSAILVTHPGSNEAWRHQELATLLRATMPAINRFPA